MLTTLLIVVMLVCIAMLWNEGLWGNAIALINIVVAALIATNYFEPLAAFLDSQMQSYTYLWDFLSIWLIFAVTFGILRTVTDRLSRTRVHFKKPVEHVGRVVLAIAAGYVMVTFTCMTLHTAPLPEQPFGGAFHSPAGEKELPHYFLGMAPDRQWLAFVHSRSAPGNSGAPGALSRWAVFGWKKRQFDPDGRFIFKYGARRRKLEQHNRETGALRVRTE